MIRNVILPDLGEEIEKATISFWHVEEGDSVRQDDDILEVTTEKATFNVQAPCDGIITEILAAEGDVVYVGDELAIIQEDETVEDLGSEEE